MKLRCRARLLLAVAVGAGRVVSSSGLHVRPVDVCPHDETFGPWKAGPNGQCYKAVKVLPGKVSLSLCAKVIERANPTATATATATAPATAGSTVAATPTALARPKPAPTHRPRRHRTCPTNTNRMCALQWEAL